MFMSLLSLWRDRTVPIALFPHQHLGFSAPIPPHHTHHMFQRLCRDTHVKCNFSSHLFMDILTILVGGTPFQDFWPFHVRNMYSKFFFFTLHCLLLISLTVILWTVVLNFNIQIYLFLFLMPYLRNLCQFYNQKAFIFFKYLQFIILYLIFCPMVYWV